MKAFPTRDMTVGEFIDMLHKHDRLNKLDTVLVIEAPGTREHLEVAYIIDQEYIRLIPGKIY